MEGKNCTADEQLTLEGQTTTEGQIAVWRIRGDVGVRFIMKDRTANRYGVYWWRLDRIVWTVLSRTPVSSWESKGLGPLTVFVGGEGLRWKGAWRPLSWGMWLQPAFVVPGKQLSAQCSPIRLTEDCAAPSVPGFEALSLLGQSSWRDRRRSRPCLFDGRRYAP